MFAYCLNNPIRKKDVLGSTSVDIFDGDGDPSTEDDLRFDGGRVTNGNPGTKSVGSAGITSQSNPELPTVKEFLESQGQDPSSILDCFNGDPKLQTLTEDTTVYRTWGGTTEEYGHWVSPCNYGEDAREMLSLPPGNSMEHTSTFVMPAGTQVISGPVAPHFGQPGGGIQWWVTHIGF